MRFVIAYYMAFCLVQAVKTVMNRQADISNYGLGELLIYNAQTVVCYPVACNGIQMYEWISLPVVVLAAVWLLGAPIRGFSVLTTP